jgi:hypothetical protein
MNRISLSLTSTGWVEVTLHVMDDFLTVVALLAMSISILLLADKVCGRLARRIAERKAAKKGGA